MGTTAEKLAYLQETKNQLVSSLTDKLSGFITFDASKETFRNLCTKYVDAIGSTSIKKKAFYNCSGLASIVISDSVTSIGVQAFSDCTNLTSVTIGNGVKSIDLSAFENCTNLTSISVPDSVTIIGRDSFHGCSNLTSVTIGNGVTYIGEQSFWGCSALTSVSIPNSVTSIGGSAFHGCSNLTSVTLTALLPPTLQNDVFTDTNSCPIYVPAESVDVYKSASGWSTYASRIQAIQS